MEILKTVFMSALVFVCIIVITAAIIEFYHHCKKLNKLSHLPVEFSKDRIKKYMLSVTNGITLGVLCFIGFYLFLWAASEPIMRAL